MMQDWMSRLPMVGRFFRPAPEAPRQLASPMTPQLNAEKERNRQLESMLATMSERERLLRVELEGVKKNGAENSHNLSALEEMLGEPERGMNAVVYYQFRHLWSGCHQEIRLLVEELRDKMEQEENEQQLSRFRTRQEEEARQLKREMESALEEWKLISEKQRELERELKRSGKFWQYFRRRQLQDEIRGVRLELEPVDQQIRDIRGRQEAMEDRPAPVYTGLSVEGRRRVNLAAIAMAQYFYLMLRKDSIVDMARGARNKAAHEAHYGPQQECLNIMEQIREASMRLRADRERPEKVRRRALYLSGEVSFEEEMQTVPDLRSLDYIQPGISEDNGRLVGDGSPVHSNVLEMDLWDLRERLL